MPSYEKKGFSTWLYPLWDSRGVTDVTGLQCLVIMVNNG